MPIVIELGGRDIDQGVVTMTRRDDESLSRDAVPRDGAADAVVGVLGDIQLGLSRRPSKRLRERTRDDITTLDEFREFFSGDETDSGGFVSAPWSEEPETEKTMGELGVSVRCIPFDARAPAGRALRDHRRPRQGDGDLRQGVLDDSRSRAASLTSERLL